MKVSVIMPAFRPDFIERAINNFQKQDYDDKELIIIPTGFELINAIKPTHNIFVAASQVFNKISIGYKRNAGCHLAQGEIILHMDDDDYYAPDWITKSVEQLISSKADLTGLSSGYFHQIPDKVLRYDYPKVAQPYVLGATMCYWRKTWERNPFKDIDRGEDTLFCANAGRVVAHEYTDGFMAMLHGGNTSSHLQTVKKEFTRADISIAKHILGEDYSKYVSLLGKSS